MVSPIPKLILAIDPGEAAGVALYHDKLLVSAASTDGASWQVMSKCVRELCKPYLDTSRFLCIIEDGWGMGRGSKTLDRRRGIAQAAAESCGFYVVKYIFPATWQAHFWGALKGRNTKELSVAYSKQIAGSIQIENHNVADAVLLGKWAVDTLTS